MGGGKKLQPQQQQQQQKHRVHRKDHTKKDKTPTNDNNDNHNNDAVLLKRKKKTTSQHDIDSTALTTTTTTMKPSKRFQQIKSMEDSDRIDDENDIMTPSDQQQQQQAPNSNKIISKKRPIGNTTTTTTTPPLNTTPPSMSPSNPLAFTSIQPPLSPGILQYLHAHNFITMTPVQAATLPHFLTHKDVAVQAVTGSGKTLAFLIPCMEMILRRTTLLTPRQVGALILSPTRELAQQTFHICQELCQYCSLPPPLLLVGGGGPVTEDLRLFQHVHHSDIVIGTPGRIEDVLTRYNVMDVSELECLILDEADVLLDMGFDMTLQHILACLPKMRRTGLFSATGTASASAVGASSSAKALATQRKSLQHLVQKSGMRNPIWIHVAIATTTSSTTDNNHKTPSNTSDGGDNNNAGDTDNKTLAANESSHHQQHQQQATPSSLTNYYMITPLEEKISRLYCFLQSHRHEKVIVFFLTCASVEFYGKALQQLWKHQTTLSSTTTMTTTITTTKKSNKESSSSASAAMMMTMELLHGKMVQKRRECAVERFRKCLATTTTSDDNDNDNDGGEEAGNATTTTTTTTGAFLFCTDVASRGLDITDVDWVVQFDAPQGEPSSFVHRVGRCARAGRSGCSLLLLTPKEEAYVDLLRMRHVPLQPLPTTERCCAPPPSAALVEPSSAAVADDDDQTGKTDDALETKEVTDSSEANVSLPQVKDSGERIIRSAADPSVRLLDVLPKIRDMVLRDRDLLEKGTKAFTSYIRAYKDHHCSFIFRFPSLDLGVLATSFCLLRLPKMPELRDQLQKVQKTFTPAGPEVDIHAIPFLDKVREDARQKRLAAILAAGGKNAKQIKAEQRQAARLKKEQDRRQSAIAKGRNPDKKRGRNAQIMDEWDDLAKEERLYKKLRRGKISKEQYKKLMHGDNDKEASGSEQDSSSDSE